jgi:hypothetical protein
VTVLRDCRWDTTFLNTYAFRRASNGRYSVYEVVPHKYLTDVQVVPLTLCPSPPAWLPWRLVCSLVHVCSDAVMVTAAVGCTAIATGLWGQV